jgi:hypothetical protein
VIDEVPMIALGFFFERRPHLRQAGTCPDTAPAAILASAIGAIASKFVHRSENH